ncbi:hypothetical protein HBHAL_4359 [Halobacillus halophilus DSM 2266]|uniref:Uncharacterized protein n=1 Tax=Halobacillus halophilus (strain ATCC 35676 / DSM 2266 / JCM 20832 / KCTC 3685 / LMG 17431 / NBRC 102448 / NCIMB 2269) TaxID=866895 RepID=I0JRD0_HALH3|nr:hypothetical protein HBHAL_4359 [Halobacillus halophilus DSM 2266]
MDDIDYLSLFLYQFILIVMFPGLHPISTDAHRTPFAFSFLVHKQR